MSVSPDCTSWKMGVGDGAGEYVGVRSIVGVAVGAGLGVFVTPGVAVGMTAAGLG